MRKLPKPVRPRKWVSAEDMDLVDDYVRRRFTLKIPSPIAKVLRVKRLGNHFGARIVLFDGGHCLLIVAGKSHLFGESRWIFRGLPAHTDQRPFFFDLEDGYWARADAITTASEDEYP